MRSQYFLKISYSLKKILCLSFTLSFPLLIFPDTNETKSAISEKSIRNTISKIIANEKQLHGIKLSDKEAQKALAFLFDKKGITLSSFSKVSNQSKIIIAGLQLFVDKKGNPTNIYENLKMNINGIEISTWNYYVKNYSSTEKIRVLEKLTPDSMEKIIDSGLEDFKAKLSDWLLFEKIIADFDVMFPSNAGMLKLDKEKKWWAIAIKKYQLEPKEQEDVVKRITLAETISDEDKKFMMDFFSLNSMPQRQ